MENYTILYHIGKRKARRANIKPYGEWQSVYHRCSANYGLWGRIEYVGGFLEKAPHAPPKTFEKLV